MRKEEGVKDGGGGGGGGRGGCEHIPLRNIPPLPATTAGNVRVWEEEVKRCGEEEKESKAVLMSKQATFLR